MRSFSLFLCMGVLVVAAGLPSIGQVGNASSQAKIPSIPGGALGESIRLGRDLVEKTTTHPLSKPYSGNALNCTRISKRPLLLESLRLIRRGRPANDELSLWKIES